MNVETEGRDGFDVSHDTNQPFFEPLLPKLVMNKKAVYTLKSGQSLFSNAGYSC